MFIVKLIRNGPPSPNAPTPTETMSIGWAETVHVLYGPEGRKTIQMGDAPGNTREVTIGGPDCSYTVAYIMNAESGKTIETIR